MSCHDNLRSEIERLVTRARQRQVMSAEDVHKRMAQWELRYQRFQVRAHEIIAGCLAPALETLAASFPHAKRPLTNSDLSIGVTFPYCDEFPANATLIFRIAHDPDARKLRLISELLITPMLMEYERIKEFEVDLGTSDSKEIELFVHTRILNFVREYLRTSEPGSEYQRLVQVVDPVCGMTVQRFQASETILHEGHRFYFCCLNCRQRFESSPASYDPRLRTVSERKQPSL